jgi:hypothetical protein
MKKWILSIILILARPSDLSTAFALAQQPIFESSSVYSKYFIAVQKKEGFDMTQLHSFIPLLPPRHKLYADPMLFCHNEMNYIFFEDYDYNRGVISYVTVDENLHFSEPQISLELPCHLSFPHLFQEGDQIYMTPETYALQEVGLYQAAPFPHQWKKVRTLVAGEPFADPILFKHNGYFWLFTSTSNYLLRIYFATDLMGPFLPHPINRAKIPGRNAGRVYVSDKQLFRPVMDCSQGYGRAISIRQITRLTPLHFTEKEIYHIDPNWAEGLDGTHTFNSNDNLVVYDGRRTISPSEDERYSK